MIKHQEGQHETPEYIELLSLEDKILYDELQKKVGSPNFRYNRNRRLSTINDIFEQIREFCEKEEEDKWKRYLVCGICWFEDYISINTRQLRLLISKSKSAINGALAKMGYETVTAKGERASMLIEAIPYLFGHFTEYRKWSIRKKNPSKDEISLVKKSRRIKIKEEEIECCCQVEKKEEKIEELFDIFNSEDDCGKINYEDEFNFNMEYEDSIFDIGMEFKEDYTMIFNSSSQFKDEETSKVF